jgi:tripartite-type tricarboxylate transporter receptor subunit TctC
MTRRLVLGCALAVPAIAGRSHAQPISGTARILAGFPPGGTLDLVCRLMAEHIRGAYAPTVIVEQRVGAAGRIMLQALRAADPDGRTFGITPASMLIIAPHLYRPDSLRYDPFADFIPVTPVCTYPFGLAVGPGAAGVSDWASFLAEGRRRGGWTYASPAAGSVPHFTGVQIGRSMAIEMTHVPYTGAAPAIRDTLGGQIAATINVIADLVPHHQAGRLRVIAVTSPQRLPSLPEVPTFAELGHPAFTNEEWFGALLPARTPRPLVEALNRALGAAVQAREVQEAYARLAFGPVNETPEAFAARIRRDHDKWGPIVQASGFRPEQ